MMICTRGNTSVVPKVIRAEETRDGSGQPRIRAEGTSSQTNDHDCIVYHFLNSYSAGRVKQLLERKPHEMRSFSEMRTVLVALSENSYSSADSYNGKCRVHHCHYRTTSISIPTGLFVRSKNRRSIYYAMRGPKLGGFAVCRRLVDGLGCAYARHVRAVVEMYGIDIDRSRICRMQSRGLY